MHHLQPRLLELTQTSTVLHLFFYFLLFSSFDRNKVRHQIFIVCWIVIHIRGCSQVYPYNGYSESWLSWQSLFNTPFLTIFFLEILHLCHDFEVENIWKDKPALLFVEVLRLLPFCSLLSIFSPLPDHNIQTRQFSLCETLACGDKNTSIWLLPKRQLGLSLCPCPFSFSLFLSISFMLGSVNTTQSFFFCMKTL